MDDALQRALDRATRPAASDVDSTVERARQQIAALASTVAELEAALPSRVSDAVADGIRAEVLPVARHIAEVRGLMNQVIRRIEGVEGDLLAERNARVDDLSVLVDLLAAGFKKMDARLDAIERKLGGDVVSLPLAS